MLERLKRTWSADLSNKRPQKIRQLQPSLRIFRTSGTTTDRCSRAGRGIVVGWVPGRLEAGDQAKSGVTAAASLDEMVRHGMNPADVTEAATTGIAIQAKEAATTDKAAKLVGHRSLDRWPRQKHAWCHKGSGPCGTLAAIATRAAYSEFR